MLPGSFQSGEEIRPLQRRAKNLGVPYSFTSGTDCQRTIILRRFFVHLSCPYYFLSAVTHSGVSKDTVHILAVNSWNLHLDTFTKDYNPRFIFEVLFYVNVWPFGSWGNKKKGFSFSKPWCSRVWGLKTENMKKYSFCLYWQLQNLRLY